MPDIQSVLQGPGVLVVPVRVGGGARTKVLEALACGMPVVSTALGVENLDLVAGRDFLLAETAAEMTAAVARLARGPGSGDVPGRRRSGARGRAVVGAGSSASSSPSTATPPRGPDGPRAPPAWSARGG